MISEGSLDWMRLDAETALEVLPEIREDCEDWPHVTDALDKIEAILKTLAGR